MKKSIIILLSVMALALAFSGCGGSAGSATADISDAVTDTVKIDAAAAVIPSSLPAIPNIPE